MLKYKLTFQPAGIFIVVWVIFISTLLIFFQNIITLKYVGLLYILISVLCYAIGYLSIGKYTIRVSKRKDIIFHRKRAIIVLFIFIIIGIMFPINSMFLHGYSWSDFTSFKRLLAMNNGMSIDRYTEETKYYSLANQILGIFAYSAPLFGSFCFRLFKRKLNKLLCLIGLLPCFLVTLTQSTKMATITALILWGTGFLICSFSYGLKLKINIKIISRIVFIFTLLIVFLYFSMIMRTGKFDKKTALQIEQKFIEYAMGFLPCFDIWFYEEEDIEFSYGSKTFYGISNYIGLAKREQGIYSKTISFGKENIELKSNVYTIFRPLIEDFGIYGALLFLFFFGCITKMALATILVRYNIAFGQTILTAAYCYILWSFVASFFSYTSYIAMLAVMLVTFWLVQKHSSCKIC